MKSLRANGIASVTHRYHFRNYARGLAMFAVGTSAVQSFDYKLSITSLMHYGSRIRGIEIRGTPILRPALGSGRAMA